MSATGSETRPCEGAAKPLDAAQVAGTLGVPESTLKRWVHLGLVKPDRGRFDFRDLVALRTVADLVARGASPAVIKRSVERLAAWLPGVQEPLAQLSLSVSDRGRLVVELEDALLTPGGQLELKFERSAGTGGERDGCAARIPIHTTSGELRDAAWWVSEGLEAEQAGDLRAAERAYRRAIRLDPMEPVAQLNLGNVLLAMGRVDAACERFQQATALDPSSARAWYNLAHAQDRLRRPRAAARSLRRAVKADPAFADARFNLADVLERLGRRREAEGAWRAYLRLDPSGPWADEARRRLAALRSPAWA